MAKKLIVAHLVYRDARGKRQVMEIKNHLTLLKKTVQLAFHNEGEAPVDWMYHKTLLQCKKQAGENVKNPVGPIREETL